ncbi:hypothetical protein scyTo_0014036 [Scyliorhinus torazame]|uniref:Uncharacterized protein n=1 Tax=Scyliorhinus torazame TaxID=75743 RepID=A0A401NFT6_SCYTO|nr:hypothetical protein [Scyliorhinus torazame]
MVPRWIASGPLEYFPSHNQHPAWAEIQVTAEGRDHILEIKKNEYFYAHIDEERYIDARDLDCALHKMTCRFSVCDAKHIGRD